jgi:hypothetical protein
MTPGEHLEAACEGVDDVIRNAASGDRKVTGGQLEDITDHARSSGSEALAEAASDWASGVRTFDAAAVESAARDIAELCD